MMMETEWKQRIEKITSLWGKLNLLQEKVDAVEAELNEILQISEEEHPEMENESFEKKWCELFSQVLSDLKEREENTLKAPQERWKKIQTREVLDLDKMSLDNLLELYRVFLGSKEPDRKLEIDDYFETLIEDRRKYISQFFENRPRQWFRMENLFSDEGDRREVIATFLVLLDMVFRNLLKMKEEDRLVYFLKNE